MRKAFIVLLLATVILAWLVPATAARGAGAGRSYSAVPEVKKHTTHKKKKTPTPVPHHKKKKHKKHRTAKPTPRPTARPHKTASPKPTSTNTPLPVVVNTATPTATATLVPTPTLTPTPVPLTATMALQSDVPSGYSAGFYVCGLPSGATATFAPNPSVSQSDNSSSTFASSKTVVTVSVPFTVTSNTYGLTFYAYYHNAAGTTVRFPPGGNLTPQFAVLTVQPGMVSLQSSPAVPADSGQGCSGVPFGYLPTPQPTTGPSNYTLTTWVSDAHPSTGETVTVYGQLTQAGRPVGGAVMNFVWYSYGVTRTPCHQVTDSTGTATCSIVNAYPLAGVPVTIEVSAIYNGLTFDSWTSYTM